MATARQGHPRLLDLDVRRLRQQPEHQIGLSLDPTRSAMPAGRPFARSSPRQRLTLAALPPKRDAASRLRLTGGNRREDWGPKIDRGRFSTRLPASPPADSLDQNKASGHGPLTPYE